LSHETILSLPERQSSLLQELETNPGVNEPRSIKSETHKPFSKSIHLQIERPLLLCTPFIYHFQEAAFSGRLRRRFLEYGLCFLAKPDSDPSKASRAFKSWFGISDHTEMIEQLQNLLKRGRRRALGS
jgi:hypothetical protein